MKLHLGCGQIYLDGYVNIDFPASKHTVQPNIKANRYVDITLLRYPKNSIEEIRLHHVFEHFTRPIACALLSSWHMWLKSGGILRIEVPDFQRTAAVVLSPFSATRRKLLAIRHLYGSHEAQWAIHCGGYTPESLSTLLELYGFRKIKIDNNSWKGTYNFEIIAEKFTKHLNKKNLEKISRNYLKNYLVDERAEQKLLSIWMGVYKKHMQQIT